jgi:hypothetical protein
MEMAKRLLGQAPGALDREFETVVSIDNRLGHRIIRLLRQSGGNRRKAPQMRHGPFSMIVMDGTSEERLKT